MKFYIHTLDNADYVKRDPLVLFLGITGDSELSGFQHLANYLEPGRPVVAVVPEKTDSKGYVDMKQAIKDVYKQLFGRGGEFFYHRGGVQFGVYSSGAQLGLGVALMCQQRGRTVSHFFSLDADISTPLTTLNNVERGKQLLKLYTQVIKRQQALLGEAAKDCCFDNWLGAYSDKGINSHFSGFFDSEASDQVESLHKQASVTAVICRNSDNVSKIFDLLGILTTVNSQLKLMITDTPTGELSCKTTVYCAGDVAKRLGWENHTSDNNSPTVKLLPPGTNHFSFLEEPGVEGFAANTLGPDLIAAQSAARSVSQGSNDFISSFGGTMRTGGVPAALPSTHPDHESRGAVSPVKS